MAEALVAVALIGAAAIILGSIITSAVTTTKLSKDYLVAQNLVTEAIEGVKNIRSTNRILYADDSSCWMNFDFNTNCGESVPSLIQNYSVTLDQDQWILKDIGKNILDIGAGIEMDQYQLFIETIVLGEQKYLKYTTDSSSTNDPSKFYRSVKFLSYSDTEAMLEVKVQWYDRSIIRNVTRVLTLYNY